MEVINETNRYYIINELIIQYSFYHIFSLVSLSIDCFPYGGVMKNRCDMNNTYKFYLAFENSICPDYVTEKFFDIFKYRYNVIPVVYNGADMASIAPPHSYISVRDYSSVEHLAQYLSIVSSNDTLFASYFWWRDYYTYRVSNI